VLGITLSDLRHRARQFLIAVVGAGLVFSMSLLLSGLAHGFAVEIDNTVSGFGANAFVVMHGSPGRLAALSPLPTGTSFAVAIQPGVRQTRPVVIMPSEATVEGQVANIALIGNQVNVPSHVTPTSGRWIAQNGEAVVDDRLGASVGQDVTIAGRSFRVVGLVKGYTLLGGIPDVYVTLSDAQAVAFRGEPLASAFVTTGVPRSLPPGLALLSNSQMETSTLAGMKAGVSSINNSRIFSWVIAALIVAALIYVTALQRTRDFAVLKSLGCSSVLLFWGLALQAVLVAMAAALMAMGLAGFMTGMFPQPVDIPASDYLVLPLSALAVGLLASLIALRRAVAVDPVLAFAGA